MIGKTTLATRVLEAKVEFTEVVSEIICDSYGPQECIMVMLHCVQLKMYGK